MSTISAQQVTATDELTIVSGEEMKAVLKVAGYSQREIADYIGYSRSYVNAVCNGVSPLTLRVVEAVKELLGPRLYELAIQRARLLEIEERQRREEWLRKEQMEHEHQLQEARRREEERKQAAIEAITRELSSFQDELATDLKSESGVSRGPSVAAVRHELPNKQILDDLARNSPSSPIEPCPH